MARLRRIHCLSILLGSIAFPTHTPAQSFDARLFAELRWRNIGPHRGGRTVAAVGVPGHPTVFYIGVNNGGVWTSNDYGRVWKPIFDDQPTGSIGAIAVVPSNPSVIYVGTGEGLQRPDLSTGDGVYKSTDAGKTWRNVGLRDGQQIPQILVDPRDPERVFAAVLGHPYGPNAERGVYRSLDGGRSWKQVLGKDENTGAIDLAFDPNDAKNMYAVLWAARQSPWEIGSSWQIAGSGLYRSSDGGDTWRPLGGGLPGTDEVPIGRIGIAIAPSNPRRIFAVVDHEARGGLYRSDDAGESWQHVASDPRLWGRGNDFAEVRVDPRDQDVVYVANVAFWKSTDGGKTFASTRGAPGGDDYHRLWIHPEEPRTMLLAGDQGAIITVNGGETWSSWYNQPTAQLYHVSTDNAFPYRVYGGQQESGSVGIASRGDDGQITFREWHPVGAEEYGYVAVDPLDPDLIYGGKLSRYDRRTGQVQNIAPRERRSPGYRVVRTQPVLFSPLDAHVLYFASNVLWRTTSGGQAWEQISDDLTRESYAIPGNLGAFAACDPEHGRHRGVIYTIAPSPLDAGTIWCGTDDGRIHVTRDGGKQWSDVTPKELVPWAKVSLMDASHFAADVAYAAINTFRLDDLRPHIYRTRDGGRTWSHVTSGIESSGIVNVVREDPRRRGLLYAGTECAVFVSFDDGEHWQSLRLNMPATSIRDLVVKDDDLVIATHGRSFWILDDVTPLRQIDARVAASEAHLFAPQPAIRVRWNQNTDTPLPQEEPAGENPPDGAIVDYWLAKDSPGPITLEVFDAAGARVRRYASDDASAPPIAGRNIPDYWIRPPQPLTASAGMHRFVWDLRHAAPAGLEQSYPIAAIHRNTPRHPLGTWVLPGRYTVKLTASGNSYTQPLDVKMDPRVRTSREDLVKIFELSRTLDAALAKGRAALLDLRKLKKELAARKAAGAGAEIASALHARVQALEGDEDDGLGRRCNQVAGHFETLDQSDSPPTSQLVVAISECVGALEKTLLLWHELETRDLADLNERLQAIKLEPIRLR